MDSKADDRNAVFKMSDRMLESADQQMTTAHLIVTVVVTGVVLIAASVSTWAVRREQKLPANRHFLSSLITSDLLMALTALPLSIAAAAFGSWNLPPQLWLIQVCLSSLFWLVGIYSLAFINIDHYVAITEPAHYLQQLGPRKSLCWVMFIWTLGIVYCLPLLLIGPQRAIICSTDLMFCLFNHDLLATYSATAISILLPPPLFIFLATGRRGLFPHGADHTSVSDERLSMYKANTVACIVTLVLWTVGLAGTFSYGSSSLYRLVSFWLGLSTPFWRTLSFALLANSTMKRTSAVKK